MTQLSFHETMVVYTKALTLFGSTSSILSGAVSYEELLGQENFDLAMNIYLLQNTIDEQFVEVMLDYFPAKDVALKFFNLSTRDTSKLYLKMKWEL